MKLYFKQSLLVYLIELTSLICLDYCIWENFRKFVFLTKTLQFDLHKTNVTVINKVFKINLYVLFFIRPEIFLIESS